MNGILSFLPIVLLLVLLLGYKQKASKAGAIVFVVTLILSLASFGMGFLGVFVAIGKGLSLAFYVLLIIWTAVLIYNTVTEFKALEVINKNITLFVKEPFVQFLILSWLFSAVLQGIAGFGVPVVIVVPILILLGFDPLKSASAVLLGHSWAISFGSMGSSYFTIYLVTGLDQQSIGYAMALYNFIAMIGMGIAVCYVYGGIKAIKDGALYIFVSSIVMVSFMLLSIYLNMSSLIGLITALSGTITMYILYKFRQKTPNPNALYKGNMTLAQALLPYGAIVGLSLLFQVFKLKASFSFNFPETITSLGHFVKAEPSYATIKLFGHPAPIIVMALIITWIVYKRLGIWNSSGFKTVVSKTIAKCVPTTISLAFLISMALLMMDSGMTTELAKTVAALTGRAYTIFAPFIGILGSFITGSNTNSNVIFGSFQISIATLLGVNPYIMAGLQSISGSIGGTLGPTNILMASSSSGYTGRESELYAKVIKPIVLTAIFMGIVNFLILNVFKLF